ncbi:MAG: family 78 glycoside hydrolase catalytic domain [Verrucomicrobiota bacterium]
MKNSLLRGATPRHWPCLVILLALLAPAAFAATVEALRCENLVNPEGLDAPAPRLSWQLASKRPDEIQTAWQVLVATSPALLREGRADLWDSGKVASPQSILVPYAGRALPPRADCFWKVRVWDARGKASSWSEPARWSTGIFSPEDWHAQWIGQDGVEQTNILLGTSWIWYPGGHPEISAPLETNYFRRVITLPANRKIRRATFEYTGDNECRGWLNDFDLGARNNYKSVKWNDITTRLEPGKTYLFAFTGRNTGNEPNPAGLVGKLTVEFTTGEPMIVATDDQWRVSKTLEPGWNTLNFDDSKWRFAQVLGPAGMQPWPDTRVPEDRRQPARWLRKEFSVDKKIRRATVSCSGLGLSELYLNGDKVGDAVLSPALSQYDKHVLYVTHDVTRQVRNGVNAIGAVLGGGRFYADRSKVYSGTVTFGWPKLLLNLRIEFTDGTTQEIVSDASWKITLDGPIRSNSEYDGEFYDARMELDGWNRPGFDASRWQAADVVAKPAGQLVAVAAEPMRVTGTLKPRSVKEVSPGVFIFDMGQNMVGWCRLHVSGPRGTAVQLRHAETLKPDGNLYMANLRGAQVTDTYTLRGTGAEEVYEPRFTYHGFRFVEVTGFPGKPTLASLEGRVVNDDLPVAGEFVTSNELINQIYTNIVWGTRGNYRSIPTDCPQRDERQGWLGDRSEECRGESYLFDMSKLYAKWLRDISDAQRPSGSVPDVAPTSWSIYSDNVVWPSTLVIAPGVLRCQFGDTASIAARYDSCRKWLDYMAGFFKDGIITKDSYGDWCVPPEDPKLIHSKDPARQTDKGLLATSYFFHDLKLMEQYATLLGKTSDAAHFATWAEEVKTAFNQKYLNREKGQYDNGSQTSCVLPLAFGLVPEDMTGRIFAHLVDKIENETRGHIGTGLVGGQYLMRVLSQHGRPDLAYTIATQKDYPGWGYMIANDATTIWELWNGNTADPTMNSGNHVMLVGDLVVWFYENLAGIKPDPAQPGFKHVILQPTPVGDLKFVKATHRSPYGLIASEWRKDGGKFDWQIEIPANTTATVVFPLQPGQCVKQDGKKLPASCRTLSLGSGKYRFVCE